MDDDTKLSILIVDDEKANLDVLNHILKSEYTIYVAKSGKAAITRAIDDKPDLIILDVIMPDMSGFDVLTKLKETDSTRAIPVIFITGLVKPEDEERGFFLGAVDYITKPFNNSIVKARVKTHLKIVKQMRTIEKLCLIDSLTDIPNRRSFDNQINTEWGRAIRDRNMLSLLMIDVDYFKNYNDTYGHPQGDVLLQMLSKIIYNTIRRPGDYAARIGGEEFVVLLPGTDIEGAKKIAEQIRGNVENAIVNTIKDLSETKVTVSIGVTSIYPYFDKRIDEFIERADKALYKAKATGRNRVCVEEVDV